MLNTKLDLIDLEDLQHLKIDAIPEEKTMKVKNGFRKISLDELHDHLTYMKDLEYTDDNWYAGDLPLAKLVIAHDDFQQILLPFQAKEQLYIDYFPLIRPTIEHDTFLRSREIKSGLRNIYPSIVAVEDYKRLGQFRVWDGQTRVFTALYQGIETISSIVYFRR